MKEYKVWIEIEEVDEDAGTYEDVSLDNLHFGSITFSTLADAIECANDMHRAGNA